MILDFINWHVNPEIFPNTRLPIRWYGLLFVSAFYVGLIIMQRIFKKEGYDQKYLDKLTMYMLLSTIIGARLGHCLFYEPDYFLTKEHFIEILFVWQGGLASHGAGIAIILTIWLFVRKYKQFTYLWVIDRIVITVALAGFFIRMGNLMNSEIYGIETTKAWGFVFMRDIYFHLNFNDLKDILLNHHLIAENQLTALSGLWSQQAFYTGHVLNYWEFSQSLVQSGLLHANQLKELSAVFAEQGWITINHPTQIYESASYLLIFIFLLWYYYKMDGNPRPGYLFGFFLILVFSARFLIETIKENQVPFEEHMSLNMGQLLSIPFVLAGVVILLLAFKRSTKTENQ